MNGETWLGSLFSGSGHPAPVDWSDVLVEAETHSDPVGWLADQIGVTRRSGERYLAAVKPGVSESQQPKRGAAAVNRDRLIGKLQAKRDREAEERNAADAAELLRNIKRIKPGKVEVKPKSPTYQHKKKTYRTIRWVDVDLGEVADAVEAGELDDAAELLSDELMEAYGRPEEPDLGAYLRIVDYTEPIDYR